MILRSIFFRLTQFITGCIGLNLLLMAGTFVLQTQFNHAIGFGVGAGVSWLLWAILTFVINRFDQETIREVAVAVYPTSALIALVLGVVLGLRLESMMENPKHQAWTLIIAGVLLAGVMIIRCLDIRWMRNAADLRNLEEIAHHDHH